MKQILLFFFVLLFFLGCSASKQILIKNDKDSNFNLNSDAVPITILLFQLKDIAKFKNASPRDLIERPDIVLGKDKIDVARMQIAPESEKVIATINKDEVPFIGVLAIYNNMQKKQKVKSLIKSSGISKDLLELQIKQSGIYIIGKNKKEELMR